MKSTASSVAEWRISPGAEPALQLALLAGRRLGVDELADAFLEAERGGLSVWTSSRGRSARVASWRHDVIRGLRTAF